MEPNNTNNNGWERLHTKCATDLIDYLFTVLVGIRFQISYLEFKQ